MRPHVPLSTVVMSLNARYQRDGRAPTLLGIGPMSEEVLLAALELGKGMDFPVMFIASRNQIDSRQFGSGYVKGWDQADFVASANRLAERAGFDGLLYICRDHGGPWQRDEERRQRLPADEAMQRAKASYLDDLHAGFSVLHIDPTKAPDGEGPVPVDVVMKRTVELLSHIEEDRRRAGLPEITYEIGTDETSGGLTEPQVLRGFVEQLHSALERKGLPQASLLVGQTGTLLKMDRNIGGFNAEHAKRLADLARSLALGLKEHNTDYLSDEQLRKHPGLGITAANVAPDFGRAHTASLMELAADAGDAGFITLVERKALESRRWQKWLLPEQAGMTAAQIAADAAVLRQVGLVCGHYVYDDPEVAEARQRLFAAARQKGIADPERRVLDGIKSAIRRYADPFSLAGVTSSL